MGKIVTIAPTPPKFSEVWMSRMNDLLAPENLFISLASSHPIDFTHLSSGEASLSRASSLPIKVHLKFYSKSIRNRLNHVLDRLPDDTIILCHYLTTAVYLWEELKKRKNKIFIYCHGHDVTWDRRVERFPLLPAHGLSYLTKVKKFIGVGRVSLIANSLCTKEKLLQIGFTESDIHLNYLSINTDNLRPRPKTESSKVNILYLGRLTDFKGPIETIKAFELAKSKGLDGDLHVVGGGPLEKECTKLIAKSAFKENIHLHGPVGRDEAINFLGKADIFTAHNKKSKKTGQEEALGVSIIEAMSFGIPVVTGKSAGVTETVVDGKTGFLVPPGNIKAHSDVLLRLSSDKTLRNEMGSAGRKRAIDHFDSKKDALRLRSILGLYPTTCGA